ncbi:MAG: hypothetical protein LBK99_05640 [Opitutaceae bacterium]|nr:hypothetical protein [Opitutaceae bacterium]
MKRFDYTFFVTGSLSSGIVNIATAIYEWRQREGSRKEAFPLAPFVALVVV